MTLDDHHQAFTAAAAALMADFGGYLDRGGANPFADEVSYRQFVVWLTLGERSALMSELGKTVRALLRNQPDEGRAPYILSTVFFPAMAGEPVGATSAPGEA